MLQKSLAKTKPFATTFTTVCMFIGYARGSTDNQSCSAAIWIVEGVNQDGGCRG